MLEDLRETEENGQIDAPNLQPVDQLLEVDALRRILVGMDEQVPVGPHRKVAIAPACDLVQVGGIRRGPMLEIEVNRHAYPNRGTEPRVVTVDATGPQQQLLVSSVASAAAEAMPILGAEAAAELQTRTRVHPGRAKIASIATPRAVRSAAIASHAP